VCGDGTCCVAPGLLGYPGPEGKGYFTRAGKQKRRIPGQRIAPSRRAAGDDRWDVRDPTTAEGPTHFVPCTARGSGRLHPLTGKSRIILGLGEAVPFSAGELQRGPRTG